MRPAVWVLGMAVAFCGSWPAGAATTYPWCTTGAAHDFGARNCGFVSFEQCMQSARGNGQNCERNPMYEGPVAATRAKKPTGTGPKPSH